MSVELPLGLTGYRHLKSKLGRKTVPVVDGHAQLKDDTLILRGPGLQPVGQRRVLQFIHRRLPVGPQQGEPLTDSVDGGQVEREGRGGAWHCGGSVSLGLLFAV